MRQTLDDVEFGAMLGPWPLNQVETSRISLSRRLRVREERGSGWRTRVVDHKTEKLSGPLNTARGQVSARHHRRHGWHAPHVHHDWDGTPPVEARHWHGVPTSGRVR